VSFALLLDEEENEDLKVFFTISNEDYPNRSTLFLETGQTIQLQGRLYQIFYSFLKGNMIFSFS